MSEEIYATIPLEDDGTPIDWTVFDKPLPLGTPRDPREAVIQEKRERRLAEIRKEMKRQKNERDGNTVRDSI